MVNINMETLDTLYVFYAELAMAGWTDQEIKYLDAVVVKDPRVATCVRDLLFKQNTMRENLRKVVLGE